MVYGFRCWFDVAVVLIVDWFVLLIACCWLLVVDCWLCFGVLVNSVDSRSSLFACCFGCFELVVWLLSCGDCL